MVIRGLRRLRLVTRRLETVRRLRTGFLRRVTRRLRRTVVLRLRRRGFTSRISLILSVLNSCIGKFILTPDNMKRIAVR